MDTLNLNQSKNLWKEMKSKKPLVAELVLASQVNTR